MKTKLLIFATAILMAMNLQAQAPEKFNYQGIARDNTGAPLTSQNLGIQISITDGTTAEYVERHVTTTNGFGLYTLQIGDGTIVSGTFGAVNWAAGSKFIKVEIDPNGGTSYTDLGTTELLSVPYALYAAEAPSSGGPPTGAAGGDLTGNYPNPAIAGNAVTSAKIDNGTIATADLANNSITDDKIVNGEVTTADLGNNVVTGAKINDMGASSGQVLKYDGTDWAPATDIQGTTGTTYTAGAGIGISGTNVISADLGSAVQTAEIDNNAVTSGKINNGSVATADLANNSITDDKIVNGEVTTADLGNNVVTGAKINDMGASSGQVLKYDGTDWAPASDNAGSASLWTQSGSDISYTVGNVGIGAPSPGNPLYVSGSPTGHLLNLDPTSMTASNDVLSLNVPTSSSGYQFIEATHGTTDVFIVEDDGTIETAGGLIIEKNSGFLNPHIELTETSDDFADINFNNTVNPGYWTLGGYPGSAAANSAIRFNYYDGSTTITPMQIQGNGKVGIGTTNPTHTLYVVHNGLASTANLDGFTLENDGSTSNDKNWTFHVGSSSGDLYMFANGVVQGIFDATSGSYTATSDARLKKNLSSLENVLAKVMQLKPLTYQFKKQEDETRYLGFIAQEVEKIFPSIAKEPSKKDGSRYYTMNYADFGVVAIKAIQEQQKMIEALKTTCGNQQQINKNQKSVNDAQQQIIEQLQEKIAELEKRIND